MDHREIRRVLGYCCYLCISTRVQRVASVVVRDTACILHCEYIPSTAYPLITHANTRASILVGSPRGTHVHTPFLGI